MLSMKKGVIDMEISPQVFFEGDFLIPWTEVGNPNIVGTDKRLLLYGNSTDRV